MYIFRIISLLLLAYAFNTQAVDEPVNETKSPDSTPVEASTGNLDTPSPISSTDTVEQGNAAPLERVLPNPSTRRIIETVKHLELFQREAEVIKFSDDEASISGLYLPENTGFPQGGILILHDISQHAQWPYSVAPLREYLPDYGWNTLSLFFGDYIEKSIPSSIPTSEDVIPSAPIEAPIPENTPDSIEPTTQSNLEDDPLANVDEIAPDDENFNSETNSDSLDEVADNFEAFPIPDSVENSGVSNIEDTPPDVKFLELMQERVEGGLRQLNTLGQFNLVIIAHGLSANWAVETLRARFTENPNVIGFSLILIDAKQSLYPIYQLNDELAKLKIPILDLYTKNSEDMKRELQSRKNAVVRQQPINYKQIGLPAIKTINSSKHNMISRRVRGWLKTHAAGEVVTVKDNRG